jgi:hypothetical protein
VRNNHFPIPHHRDRRPCWVVCGIRHGAYLSPAGTTGLVLLASGRYTEDDVNIDELLEQGRMPRGFWVGLAQLPMSHPFTVRRLESLFRVGLFTAVPPAARPSGGSRDRPFRP